LDKRGLFLLYQHGVAVAEEAVAVGAGFGVDFLQALRNWPGAWL